MSEPDDTIQVTDEDLNGWREMARELRRVASLVETNQMPWLEGSYEERRLDALLFWMPLFRQVPWPEELDT